MTLRTGTLLGLTVLATALVSFASAEQHVTLAWDPPSDTVSGYILSYGSSSGNYPNSIDVGSQTACTLSNLLDGVTYFFIARAYSSDRLQSDPSNEANYMPPIVGGNPVGISTLSAQTISEDTTTSIPFMVRSLTLPVSALILSANSSNPSLLPLASLILGGSGNDRLMTLVPVTNQFGSATITIVVSDGVASTNQSFVVTVNPVNDTPTLDPISNLTIGQGERELIALTGISSGAFNENQSLVVTARSSDTNIISDPTVTYSSPNSSGTLTVVPVSNASGSTVIVVGVNDGGSSNNLVTRSFAITVSGQNQGPTLSAIPPQVMSEDTQLTIPITIGDVDTPADQLTLSGTSSNPGLIPNLLFGGTGTNRTVTFIPAANQFGSATVNISVSDGVASTNQAFVLTVNPVNDLPTLNPINNLTIIQSGPRLIPLTGISSGASNENQTLTVTARSSNTNIISDPTVTYSSPNGSGTLTVVPVSNTSGSAVITVSVNDGGSDNNFVSRTFIVTMNPQNQSPTLAPIPPQVLAEDTQLTIPITVGDVDTPADQLTVSGTSSNPGLIPNFLFGGTGTNRTVTLIPATNQFGSTTVTITVSDGVASTNQSFVLTVNPVNDAPTLSPISSLTIRQSGPQVISLTGISSGASNENQTLTVTARSGDTNIISDPTVTYSSPDNSGTLTVVPVSNASGSAVITVSVNDGGSDNNFVSQSFVITINLQNQAPTLAPIPDQVMAEDTHLKLLVVVADAETPANELTLSATWSNPSLFPSLLFGGIGTNRTLSLVPAANQFGSATITVAVSDGVASTNQSFVVTVNPVNDPPTLNPISGLAIGESDPQLIPLTGISSGAPNENQTLTVTARSSNTNIISDPTVTYSSPDSSGTLTVVPVSNASGSAVITVSVNDGGSSNNLVTRSFAINVNGQRPTLSAIEPQVMAEDTPLTIPITIGDVDTPADQLTLSGISSDPGLIPNLLFDGTGTNRTVTFIPAANQFGPATVSITVSDGVASTDQAFALTVDPVNDPPTLSPISSLTITQSGPQVISLTGISSGASNENQTLTVTARSSDTNIISDPTVTYSSPDNSGTLTVVPVSNASGSAVITVSVNDGGSSNNLVTCTFVITANLPKARPAILNLPAAASTSEDTTRTIPFVVNDPDTPPSGLTVTTTSSNLILVPNANIVVSGAGTNRSLVITPAQNLSGTAVIALTVSDGFSSTNASLVLTVRSANDPPTLDPLDDLGLIMNKQVIVNLSGITAGAPDESQPLAITATASDSRVLRSPTVTYQSPATTGTLTLKAADHVTGTAIVTITVNDGQRTNSQSCTVFVRDGANGLPSISPVSDRVVNQNASNAPIPFVIGDAATSANQLRLFARSSNLALLPTNNIVFGGSGSNRTVTLTPASDRFGTSVVAIAVTDPNYGFASTKFRLTVNPSSAPLMAPPSPAPAANENTPSESALFAIAEADTPINVLAFDDPVPVRSPLRIARSGTNIVLTWKMENARLQHAEKVAGPWRDVLPAPSSPYRMAPSGIRIYRVKPF